MTEKWYRCVGKDKDTIVSTRIRLARNIEHTPFPAFLSEEQECRVVEKVVDAALSLKGLSLRRIDMQSISMREREALVERHIISKEMATRTNGCVLLSNDERISIMINEEDHVRIQVMNAGEDLENTYAMAEKLDSALDERLHFAFDSKLGYLTACPTNLGTAMRASLMMHLPALKETGVIGQMASDVSKLGFVIRGALGEGSKASSALYQISNQVTLGITEQDVIHNLQGVISQVSKKEKSTREELLRNEKFEDRVWRSFGILCTARLLSAEEAVELLSMVRLGVAEGLLSMVSCETVTALMTEVGAGCIMNEAGEDMTPLVRDQRRARLVRTALGMENN